MFRDLFKKKRINDQPAEPEGEPYEFCPRCEANLTLQKGYSNNLPYWICKGCGEMLINPNVPDDSNIAWICDGCGAMLNIQPGFSEDCGVWTCTECGYANPIDPSELYLSEDEYQASLRDPYKGLSDEDALKLSMYEEIRTVGDRDNIIFCREKETGREYIKKIQNIYDISVYEYLKDHPIDHMPRIIDYFEGDNALIVIEEYIEGRTVDEILRDGPVDEHMAFGIVKQVCEILDVLHHLPRPIIHRDIKPSNVMIAGGFEAGTGADTGVNAGTGTGYQVYLLDVNVAKWYDPDETDDTKYLGTQFYAAPEQVGYGMSASCAKSDIYAAGMLLNVMPTGKFPKEELLPGAAGEIVKRCISLEPEGRYSARELIEALEMVEAEASGGA